MHGKISPTSIGLLRCLQAIAEEAESLGLMQTRHMLERAIESCQAETTMASRIVQPPFVGTVH